MRIRNLRVNQSVLLNTDRNSSEENKEREKKCGKQVFALGV